MLPCESLVTRRRAKPSKLLKPHAPIEANKPTRRLVLTPLLLPRFHTRPCLSTRTTRATRAAPRRRRQLPPSPLRPRSRLPTCPWARCGAASAPTSWRWSPPSRARSRTPSRTSALASPPSADSGLAPL